MQFLQLHQQILARHLKSCLESMFRRHVITGRASVLDGDCLYVGQTKIRLFGVDAPELNHPYGVKAKWALVNLCTGNLICAKSIATDWYGRRVARCTLPDGRDLSAEMVKQGLALDWPKYSCGRYAHLEPHGARRMLWLADARQQGQIQLWRDFDVDPMPDAAKNLALYGGEAR